MAKSELATLPKSSQKIAKSAISAATRAVRDKVETQQALNTAIGFGSVVGAAYVDHKWRKGAESEAFFGEPSADGGGMRPPVNAVIGAGAVALGLFGPKKYAGSALSVGLGFGGPALYSFTRNQLAK